MEQPNSFYVSGEDTDDGTGQQLRTGQTYVRRFPGHSTPQPQGALPVIMLHGGAR